MATEKRGNRNSLLIGAAAVIVLVAGLFLFSGGHNNGQPSSPTGPGNAMQNDQGR